MYDKLKNFSSDYCNAPFIINEGIAEFGEDIENDKEIQEETEIINKTKQKKMSIDEFKDLQISDKLNVIFLLLNG